MSHICPCTPCPPPPPPGYRSKVESRHFAHLWEQGCSGGPGGHRGGHHQRGDQASQPDPGDGLPVDLPPDQVQRHGRVAKEIILGTGILKVLTNEKRGGLRVISFDRSPFKLFSRMGPALILLKISVSIA